MFTARHRPARRAAHRGRHDGDLAVLSRVDLRRLRPRGGGLPVLREGRRSCRRWASPTSSAWTASACSWCCSRRSSSSRACSRRGRCSRAQPGVLRAAARPRDRRVRRVLLARPVRALPLLRARRAPDVPAHRDLGLERRGAAARDLRVGVPRDRRGHEGVRGDEADAVPAVRVGVHPGRDLRALRQRGRHLVLASSTWRRSPSTPGSSAGCSSPSTSGFGILAGIWPLHTWSPDGHAVGADRRVDAPRRRADEARRLRRGARGDGAPARGRRRPGVAGGRRSPASTSSTARSRPWRRPTSSTSSRTRRSRTWAW